MLLDASVRSLHLAIRVGFVAKYLGQLMLPLAALTCVPLVVSLAAGRLDVALRYVAVIVLLVGFAWPCVRLRTGSGRIQPNEALAVSALVFVVSAVVMTLPLMGYGLTFIDALFESVSGVTTTGLSTLGTVAERPTPFLFARAWMQWVGGLGVVVLALAMLIDSGPSARQLGFDKREREDVAGGTRAHARRVLAVYLILTAAGIVALLVLGVAPEHAVFHTLAAVSTGGFSSFDASLADIDSWSVRAVILATCLAGAISFGWYYRGLFRDPRRLLTDERLIALLLSIGIVTGLLFVLAVPDSNSWQTALADSAAMAISAQSTAGFSTTSLADVDGASKLVLIGSMFIGGETGSTSGGIKILRLLILIRLLQLMLARVSLPRTSVTTPRVAGERTTAREVEVALAVVVGYLLVVVVSWFAFLVHGYDALDALFEVVSATSTSGLSTGLARPDLEPALKLVLCLDMLMGRVEVIALLVLMNPLSWIGRRNTR